MTGPDTSGPPSGPKFDRLMAKVDTVISRLTDAVIRDDKVAHADASGSIADLRAAWHLADGRDVTELDRNGWPVTA